MQRSVLLHHLRKTRFALGDEKAAMADARKIAAMLKSEYDAEVIGVGSLFESLRPFRIGSDIDLVVKGIPKNRFLFVSERAQKLSDFEVNLIPWENANDLMMEIVRTGGVRL